MDILTIKNYKIIVCCVQETQFIQITDLLKIIRLTIKKIAFNELFQQIIDTNHYKIMFNKKP